MRVGMASGFDRSVLSNVASLLSFASTLNAMIFNTITHTSLVPWIFRLELFQGAEIFKPVQEMLVDKRIDKGLGLYRCILG